MNWRRKLLCLGAAFSFVATAARSAHSDDLPGGRYGTVHVSEPTSAMRGFVILFSDLSGWREADQRTADLLAQDGMLVVGVDAARYADRLDGLTESCHNLVGDAETISHQLQKAQESRAYFTPIMAGAGEGGTLAEQVLAASPSNTIAGAVSLDPASSLDARFHPCPPDPTILHDAGLPGFWSIGATVALPAPTEEMVTLLRHIGAKVEIHDFAPGAAEPVMMLPLALPHLGFEAPDERDMSDLPLVELPAEHPDGLLAIVISGDGGWRDLDKTIASDLHEQGVSVVGVDSLRYFWSLKSPGRTAHDLARVIRAYAAKWRARSVALIGYSFGADVLPFVYNRLPKPVRTKITIMSLLGFARDADFEIRVMGWLGMAPSDKALAAYPEIVKVPPGLVQCFYGENETDTICPLLANTGVMVVRTPGGHHFGGGYSAIAHSILNGWRQRMTLG